MYFPEDLRTWHEHGKWADLCRPTSPRLLSTVPPQPTQSWIGAATRSGFRVGKAKNRRAWAGHANCSVVLDPFSVHLWSSKLSAGRELLASATSSQKAEGSRDAPGLAMEAVAHVQPSPSGSALRVLWCSGRERDLPRRKFWWVWRCRPQDRAPHPHWEGSGDEGWGAACCPYWSHCPNTWKKKWIRRHWEAKPFTPVHPFAANSAYQNKRLKFP